MDENRPKKRFFKDYGSLLLLVMLVVVGYDQCLPHNPDLPDEAPAFTLQQTNGSQLSLHDLQGRIVVLNFWASWCGPCVQEIPSFSEFARANPDIAVIGVNVEGIDISKAARLATRLDIQYPVVVADSQTQKAYDISTLPTTVVIGPDGQIWRAHVGGLKLKDLQRAVQPPSNEE